MEEETDYLKLPVEEKCQHKLWKARVCGYEEACKLFHQLTDEKSPEFFKYLGLVKKFVIDSNAVAQEKGLAAVLAFVENAACAGKSCGEVMGGLVTKCLAAPRAKTKELALEIILMYVEIEKQEIVQDELMKGLENKSPKVVAACINALKESLHSFGPQVITLKPIIKVIPKLLEDRDKTVRDDTKALCIETYRWAGDAIKPQLQTLKPVTLTELENDFEKVRGGRAAPTRYLRSQQQKMAKQVESQGAESAAVEEVDGGGVAQPQIDPFELMTSIDVLSKLPKDFFEQCEAKKWQERKEALETLQQLTTNVKLEPGDYGDLVRQLKKMLGKDTNVLVVSLAAKCLTNLAVGLRRKFQIYAGPCIPVIFEKFKEKKQNVVQALREAIDAIFKITTFDALMEDIQTALNNKNPQVKAETVAFLTRCFSSCSSTTLNKKVLKPLCLSLLKTLNDTDVTVRDYSAEALGTALKVSGERLMGPFLQDVDAIKMAKIKDCCDKAVVTAKQSVVADKKPAAPKSAPPAASVNVNCDSESGTKSVVTGGTKKSSSAPALKGTKAGIRGGGKLSAKKAGGDAVEQEFIERELSDEDAIAQVVAIIPEDVVNNLNSSNWKERLAAAEKFQEVIQQTDKANIPAQALIKCLAKKPGFKENNFQILKLRFEILVYIAKNSQISRCAVESCLSDVVDKIGDAKNGASAATALTALAEATSLEYISQEVLQLAFGQRNPRNQSESLLWLSNAVKEFGLKVQLKETIDIMKKAFSSTNPVVRNAALSLVSTMHLYMGRTLRTFFEDEKPALLQQIDTELEKSRDLKPPAPIRGVRPKSESPLPDEDGGGEGPRQAAIPNIADMIPRTDISSQITSQLLTDLSDKNWKTRAEAIQRISSIISEAKFITPNLGDLPTALKPRLTDTNKNLAIQSLSICQMLGTALGSHCPKQVRNFSTPLLVALGDSKANVRAAALQCLNCWMENCPVSCLFEGETVCDALKSDNPFLRIELFSWLAEKLPTATSIPVSELNVCVPYLLSCLEDRNSEVRKKANDCLFSFMIHVGYEPMARAAGKLKPGSKNNVMAMLEKVRPNLPEKPSKSKTIPSKAPITSPPSPMGANDGPEDTGVSSGKGKLNRSTSKSKLTLKANTTSAKNKKEEEVDTSPPLVANNLKDQRLLDEKSLKVLRWNFTSPREEFYLQLKDQMMTANWGRPLIANCFHNDFKFHIRAIDTLTECINTDIDATAANLDLILKWLALRFFDTNPSVLIKGIEYLQMLFEALANISYRLIEAEAVSFLPYLIPKLGDPKDAVRKGVSKIIKLMCQVYPYSKMFTHIMNGLASKNARQRAECLEELGYLIGLHGPSVCQPSPAVALKEIARQISDRDNSVRNAALNCVVQVYLTEGEKVHKYVGPLSDKDSSLLEERIKRSAKIKAVQPKESVAPPPTKVSSPPMQQAPVSGQAEDHRVKSGSARPHSTGPLTLEIDDIEQMFKSKEPETKLPERVEVNADDILNLPDIQLPQTRLRPPASAVKLLNSSAEATTALNLVMAQLTAQEIPVVVEAFAQVEEVLRQDDKAEAVMGSRVDQLLVMGALQYRLAHNKHMADENICKADVIRLYRCVTMALLSLFEHKSLAKKASRDVLRDLIPHLVTVMLDARLNELQEGPQVVRAINVLIVRILQRSNPTHVMSALIKLLHECVGGVNVYERFTELVMKCLWKMIRIMRQYIDELNIDRILLDLHVFLKAYPSSTWKDRPSDTPIRTVKTILYTLVDIKGEDVMKHLMLIPNKQESDLVSYLQKLLKMKKDEDHKPKGGGGKDQAHDGDVAGSGGSKRNRSSPLKLSKSNHEALTEIFRKIGSKEHTKEGLMELYEFRQRHPEANIDPFLQRSSEFFQNYIHQGLKAIEQERVANKTPHSGTPFSPDVVGFKSSDRLSHWSTGSDSVCSNKENESSDSWSQGFPPFPPSTADTSPMDLVEWLKIVVARLGMDTTKYDDPAFLEKIMSSGKLSENDGLLSDNAMAEIFKDIDKQREKFAELKKCMA